MQALAGTGGRESERVGGVEQTTRQIQDAAHAIPQQQGTGANNFEAGRSLFLIAPRVFLRIVVHVSGLSVVTGV